MNRMPRILVGFLVGLGVGATLGILFAPDAGEKTRRQLLGTARDTVDDALETGRLLTRRAREAVDEIVDGVKDATDAVERGYSRAKGA